MADWTSQIKETPTMKALSLKRRISFFQIGTISLFMFGVVLSLLWLIGIWTNNATINVFGPWRTPVMLFIYASMSAFVLTLSQGSAILSLREFITNKALWFVFGVVFALIVYLAYVSPEVLPSMFTWR